jgi:preprotein translocase subunit YajC
MGTMFLAATSTTKSGSSSFFLVGLVLLFAIMYFVILRPQRNRQRQAMQAQRQVEPGQRIITTMGMYGTVISGDDQTIQLEIAPGVEVTMSRRAVLRAEPYDAASGLNGQVTDQTPKDAPEETETPAEHGTED